MSSLSIGQNKQRGNVIESRIEFHGPSIESLMEGCSLPTITLPPPKDGVLNKYSKMSFCPLPDLLLQPSGEI